MRRLVVFDRVTVDGYFATSEGGLDWVVPEEAFDRDVAAKLGAPGTILFGRKTYQMFESFWPRIDESTTGPHERQITPELRAMGAWINASTKWVFSRTLSRVTWSGSRLVPELDPRAVERLKAEPGKDIMIFGSGSIVSQLTEHGLVDEYQLVVTPVLLGSGRSLVSGIARRTPLRLLEAKPFSSGNVLLRYERA